MVHNEISLVVFIVGWHLIAMNFKVIEKTRILANKKYKVGIMSLGTFFAILTALIFLLVPILAMSGVSFVEVPSDFNKTRYTYSFFYVCFNILICALPLFNHFMFFLADGIFLSQITSIYLYNELSMTCLLSILPLLFVVQNHMLVRGIKHYSSD